MAEGGSNRKVARSLLALSSAAVLAVYGAGYVRTRAAADRFSLQAAERKPRPALPAAPAGAAPVERLAAAVPSAAAAPESTAPAAVSPAARPSDRPNPVPADQAAAQGVGRVPPKADPPSAAAGVGLVPPEADPPSATAPAAAEQAGYKDGTYYGWGTSRHGDIQAAVVIEDGRIASTSIAQCLTRYSCSWIAALVPRVAARQSPPTEYVSGATESSYAFYDAVVEALSQAES